MRLENALGIAERVRADLSPWCDRCEIAGSIRRQKPEVKDIEIVCIPKRVPPAGVFEWACEGMTTRDCRFYETVAKLGKVLKGRASDGKYVQIALPEGINLDLFIASPENWGLIYAIRTGSADFSHNVLARGWVRAGYKSVDGMLTDKEGIPWCVFEEEDLFQLIGVPWVDPAGRL